MLLAQTHHNFQNDKFGIGKTFPKVKQTLKALKDLGFLIGAVSNRTKESLNESLKLAQIYKYFDAIVTPEDVENPKPSKEHPLKALEILKVKPQNAYMVGDTGYDIKAGKSAGTKTIGVTYGFEGKKIKDHNPDFVIDNLEELFKILK